MKTMPNWLLIWIFDQNSMNDKNEIIVDIKNVTTSYNLENVLENVNFSIRESDFTALIGPNGGGKTTLLKVIMGLHQIKSGEIAFNDKKPARARKQIGYVGQHNQFQSDFPIRVQDAIELAFVDSMVPFLRLSKKQKMSVKKTMTLLGLNNLANRSISELSGGQIQRILIARAVVIEPKILLLDEPDSHLDNQSSISLFEILEDINQTCAIVMTTHDIGALPNCFKAIGCLNKKMHYHGPVDLSNELLNEVYGCQVDLIAHGVPHRVLHKHD